MHGTASVAYAGSLELWAATDLGPKFEAATGDGFQGRAAGSGTLASEILANEINPGVFMSVGKKNIKRLWPTGRSKFVIQLATDPLVVAYNPNGTLRQGVQRHRRPQGRVLVAVHPDELTWASASGAPTRTPTRRASTSS